MTHHLGQYIDNSDVPFLPLKNFFLAMRKFLCFPNITFNKNVLIWWTHITCIIYFQVKMMCPIGAEFAISVFPTYYFQITSKISRLLLCLTSPMKSFHCHILWSDSKYLFIAKLFFAPGIQEAYMLLNSHFCSFLLSLHLQISISFLQVSWFLTP